MTDEEALRVQAALLERWNERTELDRPRGVALLQSAVVRRPPRPGLAVGRVLDPKTGRRRLELRVTAAPGSPAHLRASKEIERAKRNGIDVNVRVMTPPRTRLRRSPARTLAGGGTGLAPFIGRCEPLHIGCSVAHESGVAGTLGAFVRDRDNMIGILSCCHVLALSGRARAGDSNFIYQPGWPDNRVRVPGNRIGTLTKDFSPFIKVESNNLDAAVARLDSRPHTGTILPNLPFVPKPLHGQALTQILPAEQLVLGDDVAKLGRTTGYRVGKVTAIDFGNLAVLVDALRLQPFTFSQVIEIQWEGPGDRAFSRGGDSGSLVFRLSDKRPVGLVFASIEPEDSSDGSGYTYAIQLDRIRDEYALTLV